MIYKFEHLNGGAEIVDPEIFWTFAGFSRNKEGRVTSVEVEVILSTQSARYSVRLTGQGEAEDRSDEAITALVNQLLEPYKVNNA